MAFAAFAPSQTFCGCFSLLAGVEATCFASLLVNILLIVLCSSMESVKVFSLTISPTVQVLAGSWAFIGIPIAVVGGVGMYNRVESNVRALYWYLLVSFFLGMLIPISVLMSGSLCRVAMPEEVRRMGSSFVCSFMDSFVFMWTLFIGAFHLYIVHTVWSAAKDIAQTPYPELMKYSDAIKSMRIPHRPAPDASFRGAPGPSGPLKPSGPRTLRAPSPPRPPTVTFDAWPSHRPGPTYGAVSTSTPALRAAAPAAPPPMPAWKSWGAGGPPRLEAPTNRVFASQEQASVDVNPFRDIDFTFTSGGPLPSAGALSPSRVHESSFPSVRFADEEVRQTAGQFLKPPTTGLPPNVGSFSSAFESNPFAGVPVGSEGRVREAAPFTSARIIGENVA